MKIKILWHSDQNFSSELIKDLDLSVSDILAIPAITCALLRQITPEEKKYLSKLRCTRKLIQINDDSYVYLFDHIQLEKYIRENIEKSPAAVSNPLNELRMRTRALSYKYPESADMYGIDLSRPRVMAILNVTPDSFSDGGRYATADAAYAHAMEVISEGADILDVGGESSRPGAQPVSEADELSRVIPVIRQIRKNSDIIISVDTYKSGWRRRHLMPVLIGLMIFPDCGMIRKWCMWRKNGIVPW